MKQENFKETYKKAINLLEECIDTERTFNKPLMPHLMRVGTFLHERGYSEDVVNAGLLHDFIEWTNCSQDTIRKEFGNHVFEIVLANTKNREIKDSKERRKDYVARCAAIGIDALIVKAADVLDSYSYYVKQDNAKEIERSQHIARLILEKVNKNEDPIFEELFKIV